MSARYASGAAAEAAESPAEFAAARVLEVERARLAELAAPKRPLSPNGAGGAGRRGPRRMWKTITAALVLFAVGSVMLWLGARSLGVDSERATALLAVGGLTFIPGSYATCVLVGSWLRWRGYRAEDLPSYDGDD
jgi:hypothetical protein